MRERRRKYSSEYRDETVKMVIETSRPIAVVTRDLNINESTLGNWVAKYQTEHAGEEPPLTVSERTAFVSANRKPRCVPHDP